jgi:hypothetical protein
MNLDDLGRHYLIPGAIGVVLTEWLASLLRRWLSRACGPLFMNLILDIESHLHCDFPFYHFIALDDCNDVLDSHRMDAGERDPGAGDRNLHRVFDRIAGNSGELDGFLYHDETS